MFRRVRNFRITNSANGYEIKDSMTERTVDPTIAGRVAGVTIMGGAVDCPGNVTEWAEANIWHDPHAAAEVFAADWPVTLVGLDVTETVRCSPADFEHLAEASPDIGGFLNRAVQFYFE